MAIELAHENAHICLPDGVMMVDCRGGSSATKVAIWDVRRSLGKVWFSFHDGGSVVHVVATPEAVEKLAQTLCALLEEGR